MEKVNNFQIAKVQPQSVAYLLLDFFANFSRALLIKTACRLIGFMAYANSNSLFLSKSTISTDQNTKN